MHRAQSRGNNEAANVTFSFITRLVHNVMFTNNETRSRSINPPSAGPGSSTPRGPAKPPSRKTHCRENTLSVITH